MLELEKWCLYRGVPLELLLRLVGSMSGGRYAEAPGGMKSVVTRVCVVCGSQVIVRDVVTRVVVAQFRAHHSPLSALAFDSTGTLLLTASVCGHNFNVFRLTPPAPNTSSPVSTCASHMCPPWSS